jgi:hypothetical protein
VRNCGHNAFVAADDLAWLRLRQRELEDELIAFCDNLDEAGLVQLDAVVG